MTKKKFNVTGMTCSACSAHVEKAVSKVPGVQSVAVSLLTNTMQVQYDEGATNPDAIIAAVVKAGYGALAYEEDYGKEYARVKDPSSYFYLVVRGDSMEPRIHDGDLALVHRQDTLENGDLGVLIYGDEGEGTLKRYIQRGNCVVLQPFNPAYNELVIKGEDLNHLHIAGRVVETKAKW